MKCKRCGGDFPHKRGTYCGECEPDARPGTEGAGETADVLLGQIRAQVCCCEDAAEIDVPEQVAAERAEMDRLLEAYRDACKAEARAALLRDAPVVFVATNARSVNVSAIYNRDPQMRDGVATNDDEDDGLWLWGRPPLTPPGTVRRYALVPIEEEGT
jgi:hypothetical protein